jgi:hypothetical protein
MWFNEVRFFSDNNWKYKNDRYLYYTVKNLGGLQNYNHEIFTDLFNKQLTFYNRYDRWKQLDLMQSFLNEIRPPLALPPGYITPQMYATSQYIEDYAKRKLIGEGITNIFHPYYYQHTTVYQIWLAREGRQEAIERATAYVQGLREAELNSLLDEVVVEEITLDNSFVNNPCLKSVYDQMGKSNKFQEYLQNFEPNASVADLRFTADDSFGTRPEFANYHNAMAVTSPPLNSNEIKIPFNTDTNTSGDITEKPDVFKAVAMIHELLHAEMYRKMLGAVKAAEISGNNLNWANWTSEQFYNNFLDSLENKYFGIFDYFTRYNYGIPVGNNPNDWQHEQMAQHYRDVIKQALTDYDSSLTETQKEALSWIGLNKANIKAWQNLTQPERNSINNTITQIKNTFSNGC